MIRWFVCILYIDYGSEGFHDWKAKDKGQHDARYKA